MAFATLGEGDKAAALFSLLNPINHARTRAEVHRYKVEPYVIAADVYAAKPHVGRGGWTWYTGLGGMDAAGRRREYSRTTLAWGRAGAGPVHSEVLAGFYSDPAVSLCPL